MSRLIWSPSSQEDLKAIDADLHERDAAAAVVTLRATRATTVRLLDHPQIGRALDEPFRVLGVRHTAYLVVYRLVDDAIEIVRIRHNRENWLRVSEAEF